MAKTINEMLGGTIGNVIEWYDFALYGFMAPVIAHLFFPNQTAWLAILATYAIFALSFFMRPIGALFYGYVGDTRGRKPAMMLSVIMMGLSTTAIGLLPTFHSIGFMAPILLLLLRLVQGFSAGGEVGSSVTFFVEHAPAKKRGFLGAVSMSSMLFGVLLASLVAVVMHGLSRDVLLAYAWRIPFVFSLIVMFVGMYFRYIMKETPVFNDLKETSFISLSPVRTLFHRHLFDALRVAALVCLVAVVNYLLLVYLPSFLIVHRHMAAEFAFRLSTSGLLLVIVTCLLTGRFLPGAWRRKALIGVCIVWLAAAFFVSYGLTCANSEGIILALLSASVLEGVFFGALIAFMGEIFPPSVRVTTMSFGYNVGFAVFAGFSPVLAAALMASFSSLWVFTILLVAASIISLIGLCSLRRPELVLIPGLSFDKNLWAKQISAFSDCYKVRVHILDSDSLDDNVAHILAGVKRKRFAIAAHSSIGAGVALALAAKAPSRVVSVMCFPGWVKPNAFTCDFLRQAISDIESGKIDHFRATLRDVAISKSTPDRERVLKDIKLIQEGVSENKTLAQCRLLLSQLDITKLLPKVQANVLIARNVEDDPWFSKEEALMLTDALQKSMSVAIDNPGHLAPYTSWRAVNSLIDLWIRG